MYTILLYIILYIMIYVHQLPEERLKLFNFTIRCCNQYNEVTNKVFKVYIYIYHNKENYCFH